MRASSKRECNIAKNDYYLMEELSYIIDILYICISYRGIGTVIPNVSLLSNHH